MIPLSLRSGAGRFVILLWSLITFSVSGEEPLWGVGLGTPCAKIPEYEQRQGSLEPAGQAADGSSRYTRILAGEQATIVYRCTGGSLSEQMITVTRTSRAAAYRVAQAWKIKLAGRLGDPIHDGLQLATWKKFMFGFLGADLDYLTTVVVWGRAKEDVMLQLRETGANQWQVSISRGSSKQEYILNS